MHCRPLLFLYKVSDAARSYHASNSFVFQMLDFAAMYVKRPPPRHITCCICFKALEPGNGFKSVAHNAMFAMLPAPANAAKLQLHPLTHPFHPFFPTPFLNPPTQPSNPLQTSSCDYSTAIFGNKLGRYFLLILLVRINYMRLHPNEHSASPIRETSLRILVLTLLTAVLDLCVMSLSTCEKL